MYPKLMGFIHRHPRRSSVCVAENVALGLHGKEKLKKLPLENVVYTRILRMPVASIDLTVVENLEKLRSM